MKALRVLFITRYNPWPPHGGARIHNFNILQALNHCFDVDLLTVGPKEPIVDALCRRVIRVSPYYGDETAMLSARRWAAAGMASMLTKQPLWLSSKTHPAMRREGRRLAAVTDYAAIHASELSSAVDLIDVTRAPLIYDAHNCEWSLLAKRASEERFPAKSLVAREALALRRAEARVVSTADAVLAVSDSDRDKLRDLAVERPPIHVLPNMIDLDHYAVPREAAPSPGMILVPGKWDWRPNAIGLHWFCDEVVPRLRNVGNGPAPRVVVAGLMTPAMATRLNRIDGVTAIRNPPDMTPLFAEASVIAAPVLVSSGTRLRLIEAMASGRPAVTTGPGALGMEGGAGSAWLQTDDAETFAHYLLNLMSDAELWRRVSETGWRFVQPYDWRASIDLLRAIYGAVTGTSSAVEEARNQ